MNSREQPGFAAPVIRSDQTAQYLRGLPAQFGGVDVKGTGAFLITLAFRQRRAAIAAEARRDRRHPASNVAARLIAGEIEDVLGWRYDFLNHCCPHGS